MKKNNDDEFATQTLDTAEIDKAAAAEPAASEPPVPSAEQAVDASESADGTQDTSNDADTAIDIHPVQQKKKKRGKVFAWIAALAVIVLLVPLISFAVHVSRYDKLYPNTYVGDISLGGKTVEEGVALLDTVYQPEKVQDKTIQLTCQESSSTIAVKNLSIAFQNGQTVSDLYENDRKGNLLTQMFTYARALFTSRASDPVMEYDEQALQGAINDLVSQYEVAPIGYTYRIEQDVLTIVQPYTGLQVPRDLATTQIENEIKRFTFRPVKLELVVTEPPALDLDAFYAEITAPAVNAYYEKVDGHVQAMPERLHCEIDRGSIESAIAVIQGGAESFAMKAVTTPPEITKANLDAQLYSETLGSFSSNFNTGAVARSNNVRLAAQKMNGIELMPGEEFSYNDIVGERTAANGFQAAPIYVGNKVESGLGGGVCQPSSTIYAAALYANMEIVERYPHSLAVSYMPGGMDATVSYGTLDFRFKNSTPYPVKVVAVTEGGTLTCKIMGYNPEKYSVQIARSSSGRTYYVTRIVYQDGVEVNREQMGTSTYGVLEKDDD